MDRITPPGVGIAMIFGRVCGVVVEAEVAFTILEVFDFDVHVFEVSFFESGIDLKIKIARIEVGQVQRSARDVANEYGLSGAVFLMKEVLETVVVFLFDFAQKNADGVGFGEVFKGSRRLWVTANQQES